MKDSSNERGMIPVLVVVFAVVLMAAIGVAVYNLQKSQQKDAQTVNVSPSPSSSPASTASPVATPVNGFVVKELGIQFTLRDDIKDLVYVIRTSNGVTSAHFSTASLEEADKAAGGKYCTPEGDAPLGVIDLTASTPGGEQAIKMIAGKYLNYAHAQSACSQDSSVMSLAAHQAQAFQQALGTAEAIH
jgi:hypothetical protein